MLKRLVIENYRSCVRTFIDLHPHLSVLIGPNGSGKTNILQTIVLLNKMTQQSEHLPPGATRAGSSRIRVSFLDGRVATALRASFEAFRAEAASDPRFVALQKWALNERNGNTAAFEVPLSFPWVVGPEWADRYNRFGHGGTVPLWAARAMVRVAAFCHGITYYSASQFTNPSSCPISFEVEGEGRRQRSFRYRGHVGVLYEMYFAQQSDQEGRYERFIDIVGPRGLRLIDGLTFKKVRTSSTNYSVRVGGKVEVRKLSKLLIIPQFKIGRLILSPNQLSEGTFKTLALLFHVITGDSSALLVEEPEVCVHRGLLSSILDLIKSYSSRRQTIISTHSDYVLDHVKPENVYSVSFGRLTGTIVRHIPKTMTPKELSALKDYLAREGNLGEYWREGGFGDLS